MKAKIKNTEWLGGRDSITQWETMIHLITSLTFKTKITKAKILKGKSTFFLLILFYNLNRQRGDYDDRHD